MGFNRRTHFPKGLNHGELTIAGSFAPNGTSAVSNASNTGIGFTVARTDAGVFTITLDDKFVSLISATASIALNAVADLHPQFGAVSLSGKTVVLNVLSGATPTDIAANANNRVHFVLRLGTSSQAR